MTHYLSRRAFAATAALLPVACAPAGRSILNAATPPAAAGPANPLVRQRADAQIFRHDDGYYYMTGSVPEYDRLVLRRSRTLAGLSTAEEVVLWRHQASGPMSGFIWAPELHLIDGRWIVYFAAGPSGGGEDVFRIRTYAVVCDGPDPMEGRWAVLGRFETPWDSFNLDSTVFSHRGTRYFAWAQREPGIETNSNLYIAPLATPLTLAAKPARLTVPTLDWEIRGFKVAEAPAVLHRNGRLFMTYSASATDARYCLGLLTIDEDANLMDPRAWTKSPTPVFTSCPETSVYGPGHNSFTVDEQGRDILVYHGRDYEAIEGDPLFNPDRHTRIQRLYYDADGTPDFGVPVGNGPLPDRFASLARPGAWLAHENGRAFVGAAALAATQFRTAPAPGGGIHLSPILMPSHHLVARPDGSITIAPKDASTPLPNADIFERVDGGAADRVRFLSRAYPGRAIAAIGEALRLAPAAEAVSIWVAI
ncbi:glycoside hydrolase family 43 protein [Sphingopyxis sp. SE2]|jgi:GH43 family beta-xylosidase|uniref:glycoside hydrolase family 43 protein n=1 Tax=Sphingopyxis sp. SE2 TaxID=1586240 RepID=UPI0028C3453B|nr:glycoside hydrolase family 43 protein [Sphingopyxis sp. SE2]MDT7527627.1 glycoside hydrolase family 43 protein [Sphingopyxis sp. SE2]